MWEVEILESARKELKKLNKKTALKIIERFEERVSRQKDPTAYAKALRYELVGFWRLRVEDYRIVFRIREESNLVQITRISHRKDVYE